MYNVRVLRLCVCVCVYVCLWIRLLIDADGLTRLYVGGLESSRSRP